MGCSLRSPGRVLLMGGGGFENELRINRLLRDSEHLVSTPALGVAIERRTRLRLCGPEQLRV